MPKAKPMGLNPAKRRKSEVQDRRAAELSLAPISFLPAAPAALKGHAPALVVYKRLMALYAETVAEVVTAFDEDVLTDYCLAMEEFSELRAMREAAVAAWKTVGQAKRGKKADPETAGRAAGAVLALDARLDMKREKCQRLRESLYLTPRSRAGVKPPAKPAEPEKDEMEALLAEAQEIIR